MEDFTKVRIRGLFDDSKEEFPVERTVEHKEAGSIMYIEDGRYIERPQGGNTPFELYNENGELINRTRNVEGGHLVENQGTRVLYSNFSIVYLLDVANDYLEIAEPDTPDQSVWHVYFGADRNTLFAISRGNRDVYKMSYVEETRKWKIMRQFDVAKKTEGFDITSLLYDGFETVFVSVYFDKLRHIIYSIDIVTGDIQEVLEIKGFGGAYLKRMLTPSVCLIACTDRNGVKIQTFDIINRKIENLKINEGDVCFTPDGRSFVDKLPGYHYKMAGISQNGQRMYKRVPMIPSIIELILESPMRHPVHTHVYRKHHWIRLMSDMTIESSATWPAKGATINEAMKQLEEARYLILPIAIWSYSDREGTFEKAKGAYLYKLARAIAKEMFTSIK